MSRFLSPQNGGAISPLTNSPYHRLQWNTIELPPPPPIHMNALLLEQRGWLELENGQPMLLEAAS